MRTPRQGRSILLVLSLMLPTAASANVGVPMLAMAWPLLWLALIPVVLLETVVFWHSLRRLGFTRLLWPIGIANLTSTFVGVPLAWLAMLALEFLIGAGFSLVSRGTPVPNYVQYALFPFMAAWVGENVWQIFAAFVVLTIPFCAISIVIEERVLRRFLPLEVATAIRLLTIRANILSYGLLALVALPFPFLVHGQ